MAKSPQKPKAKKKPVKVREDVAVLGFRLVQEAAGLALKTPTPNSGKDAAAVSLGRRGGLKGGKARKKALTPERRREIAKKAAAARWGKR